MLIVAAIKTANCNHSEHHILLIYYDYLHRETWMLNIEETSIACTALMD